MVNLSSNQLPKEYQEKKSQFLGREFFIDKRVHIPRENTEPLVVLALGYINKLNRPVICADIGTGAGVIAISLCLGSPLVQKVIATDIYEEAIEVARENIGRYGLKEKIILRQGDILEPVKDEKIDIIVANLPHASEETHQKKPHLAVEHKVATLAGETGLEAIELCFKQLAKYGFFETKNLKAAFFKISPSRAEFTVGLARKCLPNLLLKTEKDKEGKERYLIIYRGE